LSFELKDTKKIFKKLIERGDNQIKGDCFKSVSLMYLLEGLLSNQIKLLEILGAAKDYF